MATAVPGSAWRVVMAFLTGRLRQQYYADVDAFSDEPDATRKVGAGYVGLVAAATWVASVLFVLLVNRANIEAVVFGCLNVGGAYYGFHQLRRRRDPRPALGVTVIFLLLTIAVLSYQQSGVLAPVMATLPVVAAMIAFYMDGVLRRLAIAFGLVVLAFTYLTSTGAIGVPSHYSPTAYLAVSFSSLVLSMLCLAALAWIANLSRDYAIRKVEAANVAIMESTARSRVAMEAAKVGLWDVPDAALRQFHVSESFSSITGYTAQEFDACFRALDQFVHADDIVSLREAFALGRKRQTRLRVDFRLKTKARGYRWFSARARYSQNPDGTIRISGSLQDINFIKAAEEALRTGRDRAREANKAKSDFIAMMSHEVRTPLNAILGSVEVLKRSAQATENAELITLIDDAGRGLLAMVNDMLDVSKIEAGKLEVAPRPTQISALLARTVDFWRPQAANKGLSLTYQSEHGSDAPVLVDPVRVGQILGNLLSNAIKFTERGGVTVTLSAHEAPGRGVGIMVSVIDTGPGVAAAVADAVFAPFEQTAAGARRGGAGLGLFISRRLARLMGGDVTLEPNQGDGAHFRLSLVADLAPEAEAAPPAPQSDPIWRGKRVLCVDDNENNRRIAQLLLSKFGVDVRACASGPEALDLCRVETFDAILMDIVMPDMDGVETLRLLRGDKTGLNQLTPTVALTAKLTSEDLAIYAAAGFDAVAGKPVNVRELAQALAPFMVGAGSAAPRLAQAG